MCVIWPGTVMGEVTRCAVPCLRKSRCHGERKNYFIYGNEEIGVEGCIKRGIPEEVAIKIFDDMTDFANMRLTNRMRRLTLLFRIRQHI